ncbi:hypothetical protein [Acinetobacter albensis]|uniref:hypothetical protein n=1 Tax=Acinetobacter albensis TaxID=1673609 RepID=UPI0038782091
MSDGLGLYLFIHKNGYKYWKFDYSRPYMKKRNTISFQITIHEIKATDIFKVCHIYEK